MTDEQLEIALDLDGVCADLQGAMIEYTPYGEDDFTEWHKDDYNVFMSEASRVWEEHWQDIEPVEPCIDHYTGALAEQYTVDIVTNTAGKDGYVKVWLDQHNVSYRNLVRPYSSGCDKPDCEYDVFIDDKPGMAGEVSTQYIVDQPWNQSVRGDGRYIYHSYEPSYLESEGLPSDHIGDVGFNVIRVTSLLDVLFDLQLHNS